MNIIEKTKMATIDIQSHSLPISDSHLHENHDVREMLATEFSINELMRIRMEHAITIKKKKYNQL